MSRSGSTRLLLVTISLLAISAVRLAAEARPEGETGPEAEALARRMLEAVNDPAWQATGAVRWTFRGNREHLWDRQRSFARVGWDDVEVFIDLTTRRSVVLAKGREVVGKRREKLAEKAYAYWINDSFWLNPVTKIFDQGTERSLVELEDGGQALLVTYSSGGLTPGDAYLWILDDAGLPTMWKMWVSSLPVGGTKATWEEWIRLDTGALVSTLHKLSLGKVKMEAVEGAASLDRLVPGGDPFLRLTELRPES